MLRYIDLTQFVEKGMPVWPGEPQPVIREAMTIEKDMCSVQSIHFNTHVGTHLDAPSHFIKRGMTLDQIPLDVLIGRAVIVDLLHKGEKDVITKKDLQRHETRIAHGTRVLLKMGWDKSYGSERFFTGFPCLALEAARYLASRKIILLGMDTPSPSLVNDPDQMIHKTLLGAGIVLLEGLKNLNLIQGDECELIALPAPFKDFSGAPCRVVAVEDSLA